MSVYKFCYKVVNTSELKGKPHPTTPSTHFVKFLKISHFALLYYQFILLVKEAWGGGVYVCVSVLHGRGLSIGEPIPLESENSIPTIKPPYLLLGV